MDIFVLFFSVVSVFRQILFFGYCGGNDIPNCFKHTFDMNMKQV